MVGVSLSPFPGFRVCSPMDSQINRPEKRTPPALQVSVSLVSWMVLQRHLKSARDKIRSWRVSGVLGMLSERHVAILAAPLTHEAAPFSTNKGIFTALNSCICIRSVWMSLALCPVLTGCLRPEVWALGASFLSGLFWPTTLHVGASSWAGVSAAPPQHSRFLILSLICVAELCTARNGWCVNYIWV